MAIHTGGPYPISMGDYQSMARQTAIYPEVGTGSEKAISYVLLGLTGEVGEITNKYKKVLRGDVSEAALEGVYDEISMEIGDVLWYLAMLATELGELLGMIAKNNVDKLAKRQEDGTLRGNGDNR